MKSYLNSHIISYQLANLRQLTFEVTDACNLKCKYCGYGEFYEDYDKRKNKNLPVKDAIKLLDYLADFWNSDQNASSDSNVYISFYGGEPLLNMEFIKEIVRYVEQKKCRSRHFTFSMTTNAILLHKYIDYLVGKKFNLLISLDGNAENTAYRVDAAGNPSFDKIINNVRHIQENYPNYFIRNISFNAVLHNKNSVEEIYTFFKKNYNKIPTIGELNNMGIRPSKQKEFMSAYRNSMESLRQSEHYEEIEKNMFIQSPVYQNVCTFLHQYSNFVYRDYNDLIYGKPQGQSWITGTCIPFSKKMYVTVNGKILPCERIGHQFALGTVNQEGVRIDTEQIAEYYNHYFTKLEKQCKGCYNAKACIQCIFNLESLNESPVCHGFMNKQAFEDYQTQIMAFLAQHPEDYYRIMEEVIIE
jgi:uncharacterized protein